MSEQITVCSNCNQPVEEGKQFCPNCAAEITSVWPPAPKVLPATRPARSPHMLAVLIDNSIVGWVFGVTVAWIMYNFVLFVYRLICINLLYNPNQHNQLLWDVAAKSIDLLVPVGFAIEAALYFVIRQYWAKTARGFGQTNMLVNGIGLIFTFFLWLFP